MKFTSSLGKISLGKFELGQTLADFTTGEFEAELELRATFVGTGGHPRPRFNAVPGAMWLGRMQLGQPVEEIHPTPGVGNSVVFDGNTLIQYDNEIVERELVIAGSTTLSFDPSGIISGPQFNCAGSTIVEFTANTHLTELVVEFHTHVEFLASGGQLADCVTGGGIVDVTIEPDRNYVF